jgi:hypothetical protein
VEGSRERGAEGEVYDKNEDKQYFFLEAWLRETIFCLAIIGVHYINLKCKPSELGLLSLFHLATSEADLDLITTVPIINVLKSGDSCNTQS